MPDAVLSFSSNLVLGLLSAVVVSRLYGVAAIGEFALISAPYVLVSQFSSVGEQVALVRTLASESAASARATSVFLVVLGFSTALTVVAAAIAAPIAVLLLRGPAGQSELVAPALILLATYVVFGNVAWNCDMAQTAFRGTRALLISRFLDVTLLLLLSVVLALTGRADSGGLVLATVVSLGSTLLLRLYLLRTVLTVPPSRAALRDAVRELPELLRFGIKIVPGALAQAATAQAGIWIISAVRTVDVVGAYSRANNLATRLGDAGLRLGEVILPSLSQSVHEGDYAGASARFSRWQRVIVLGLLAAVAPLAGAAEGVLGIFGPGFSSAWLVLGLLLFAYGAGIVNAIQVQFLFALGHPGQVSQLMLGRAAMTLVLTAPLTFFYGATGAAAALLGGFLLELLLALRVLQRRLRPHEAEITPLPWVSLGLATAGAWVSARLVDRALVGLPGAAVAVAAGIAAYAVVVLARRLVTVAELRALAAGLGGRA